MNKLDRLQLMVASWLGNHLMEYAFHNLKDEVGWAVYAIGYGMADHTFHEDLEACILLRRNSSAFAKLLPPQFSQEGRLFMKMWERAIQDAHDRASMVADSWFKE